MLQSQQNPCLTDLFLWVVCSMEAALAARHVEEDHKTDQGHKQHPAGDRSHHKGQEGFLRRCRTGHKHLDSGSGRLGEGGMLMGATSTWRQQLVILTASCTIITTSTIVQHITNILQPWCSFNRSSRKASPTNYSRSQFKEKCCPSKQPGTDQSTLMTVESTFAKMKNCLPPKNNVFKFTTRC